ncbi:APC family permease [Actinomadura violacea]|uniref:APC family permease n=1 Tax=Actinomadura violacea TaxID=2819934 RepID=A0ABS3S1G2_9ACTN|nr:APC family permease [Actinomadura violacea]MBO2462100.1 APC family permease [Actinomadura violacea]
MTVAPPGPDAPSAGLRSGAVGTRDLVFFVVAAAAPLTVMAGFGPLAFVYGGAATPSGYLLAGLIYLLFTVGFAAMSRHVSGSGAFYAYITRGLGRTPGAGAAVLAYAAYALGQIGFAAAAGLFASTTIEDLFGVHVPWAVAAVALSLLVGAMAYRRVDIGAKVMAVLLTGEIGVLLVLAAAVLLRGGHEGLSAGSFAPDRVFTSGLGAMLVIPLVVYIGFEQTAIYSEETRDPRRTVARATYIAVAFLAVFYTFISWTLYMAIGPNALAAALSGDPSTLVYRLDDAYVGGAMTKVMEVLMVTSYLAGVLALQNACGRYLFAQGREGLLPAALRRVGASTGTPSVACVLQTSIVVVALAGFGLSGLDPYRQVVVWTNTPTLVGVLALQIMTSAAVVGYLGRRRAGESPWQRLVAPGASVLVLGAVLVLLLTKLPVLTGMGATGNTLIMLPLPVAFAAGCVRALWLRSARPDVYARVGSTDPFAS